MRVLVLLEHDGQSVRTASRAVLGFAGSIAEKTGGSVACLLLGDDSQAAAEDAATLAPVLTAQSTLLAAPVADRYAKVIADVVSQQDVDLLAAASTTFAKDVVARAAGLLGGAMASDVIAHRFDEQGLLLDRPMYAGAVTATVRLSGKPLIVTVRSSAYTAPSPAASPCEIETVSIDEATLPDGIVNEGLETNASGRPDVTEARVVVSGGRAFKTSDDFERLVGGLADALGGATGSSRALVDAGITPNELQVGQTGKVVAPELYIALGISGAVQHLAGMKNSRRIVAVNSDAEAPIFEFADYGLVGDVYEVVPKLIERLRPT